MKRKTRDEGGSVPNPHIPDADPFVMRFVNRDMETKEIMGALVGNPMRVALQTKPYLVIAAQMFGSGKTQMGSNAVSRAKQLNETDPSFCQALSLQYGPEVVQRYLHARYVLVDMRKLRVSTTATGKADLSLSLAFLLYRAFLDSYGRKDSARSSISSMPKELTTMDEVVQHFLLEERPLREAEAKQSGTQPVSPAFFLHWDEVKNHLSFIFKFDTFI